MEQRNYSEHNDIRPIEELLGTPRVAPGLHHQGHKFYSKPSEPAPHAQPLRAQKAIPDSFTNTQIPEEPILQGTKRKLNIISMSHRSPVLWGLLGFAIGVAFWHFVGFWSFMEDAVLKTSDPAQSQLSASVYNRQVMAREQAQRRVHKVNMVPVSEKLSACVTLVLDRHKRYTYSVPCRPNMQFYHGQTPLRTAAKVSR